MSKYFSIGLLAVILSLCCPAYAASPFSSHTIKDKTARYSIEASYPKFGHAAVDRELENYAKEFVRSFAKLARDSDEDPAPWTAEISFEVMRHDQRMIVVIFTQYIFTGGAHPNSTSEAFNFLLPEGRRMDIAEFFSVRGLERISDISISQLKRDLSRDDGPADTNWIKQGAGRNPRNFAAFALLPDELVIVFDAYQVAPYAAGPQDVRIQLDQLKDVIRANPRAPAASFECGLARKSVELAICASHKLAQLDRHVSEFYLNKLMWAHDERARTELRGQQRAWLKQRDATCVQKGSALATCLIKAYEARLKALEPE